MPTTLFSEVPDNIADLRQRLFSLEEPLELPRAEWDLVWPYVDNIWVKNKDRAGADGRRTVYYLCRRHSTKTWVPKEKDGGRQRQRVAREAIGCGMRFKAVFTATSVTATRTNECERHCHDLELLDFQKKNSGVMALAANEASKGYKISHVAANMTARHHPEQRSALKDLGGHWITLLDVHNSATAYKSANPEVRQAGVEALADGKGYGAEDLAGTESQRKRRGQNATAKKQWLEKKALEWDLREAQRVQEAEDSQIRKAQWKPPKGSRKRLRRDPEAGKFLPSDKDSEGSADAPWEHDEPIVI